MIFQRDISLSAFDGNVANQSILVTPMLNFDDEATEFQVICPAFSRGSGLVAASGTFALDFPEDYDPVLFTCWAWLRILGTVEITVTSSEVPPILPQKVLVAGTSTQPGIYVSTGHLSAISVHNPTGAAVQIQWCIVQLPDVTKDSSFRGLQPSGASSSAAPVVPTPPVNPPFVPAVYQVTNTVAADPITETTVNVCQQTTAVNGQIPAGRWIINGHMTATGGGRDTQGVVSELLVDGEFGSEAGVSASPIAVGATMTLPVVNWVVSKSAPFDVQLQATEYHTGGAGAETTMTGYLRIESLP
jgi:hypothetical protein